MSSIAQTNPSEFDIVKHLFTDSSDTCAPACVLSGIFAACIAEGNTAIPSEKESLRHFLRCLSIKQQDNSPSLMSRSLSLGLEDQWKALLEDPNPEEIRWILDEAKEIEKQPGLNVEQKFTRLYAYLTEFGGSFSGILPTSRKDFLPIEHELQRKFDPALCCFLNNHDIPGLNQEACGILPRDSVSIRASKIRSYLHTNAEQIGKIRKLYLGISHLSILPPELRKYFSGLTILMVSGASLTSACSSHLPPKLQSLWLTSNKIQSFSTDKLPDSLQDLHLSNNPLTSLDASKHPINLIRVQLLATPLKSLIMSATGKYRLAQLDSDRLESITLKIPTASRENSISIPRHLASSIPQIRAMLFFGLNTANQQSNADPSAYVDALNKLYGNLEIWNRTSPRGSEESLEQWCERFPQFANELMQMLETNDQIRSLFHQILDTNTKNKVFGKVWELAGCPETGDFQWGEHHAFDEGYRFFKALGLAISE